MAFSSVYTCAYLLVIGMSALIGSSAGAVVCPCKTKDGCVRPNRMKSTDKEVFVVTNGTADYKTWEWGSLTSVIATEDNVKTDVMCFAHQMHKKYGFMVQLDYKSANSSSPAWVDHVVSRRNSSHADFVTVKLMNVLKTKDPSIVSKVHSILMDLKKALTPKIHYGHPIEMVCVVPWKPACYSGDCSLTQDSLYHSCDWIMIDPSSFEYQHEGSGCKARATVPFTMISLGVDEYASVGINEDRIIMGIPWHGYKYSCKDFKFDMELSTCTLKEVTGEGQTTPHCDVAGSREMISVGELLDNHQDELTKKYWSKAYKAPMFDHCISNLSQCHQFWYENVHSLRLKYQYVHDFGLKGIAIYFAEDLSKSHTPANVGFTGGMWNWVLHGIIQTTVQQPPPVKYHPDVVAGVAVGCLLLGLVLGVLFTCLGLRNRVRKTPGAPLKRDHQVEYHDEDDDLNL
ncbi:di-N-acetylchitobiase-like [Haliotis rubra]|uniref:di-N-acetylchitobiase-like n=1 Tax=Haliotis rubra TaxID=36100 RepID=UPI001EE6362F|nr:di-N-acetylchitobiase-like [Haliotis rubra]